MSEFKPRKCTDCKVPIGGQHLPGCHRQGIVTEAADYTWDLERMDAARADPPCHSRPKEQWCDREGPGGFMGHTCTAPLSDITARKYVTTSDSLARILGEVEGRRAEQDTQWGGPEHDDRHAPMLWVRLIKKFADRAEQRRRHPCDGFDANQYESNLLDVAALAVAAIQSSRRKRNA